MEGLVRLFPIHMDWMGLEKILKKFDLFGIQTHPIPLNPHGLRANRARSVISTSVQYRFTHACIHPPSSVGQHKQLNVCFTVRRFRNYEVHRV
jgi:hypothetical protein